MSWASQLGYNCELQFLCFSCCTVYHFVICSRSFRKDAKNSCIPEMVCDILEQKARNKKAQTPELQSTEIVEYLYPDNPAVYDSIRFRHSSAIVTTS